MKKFIKTLSMIISLLIIFSLIFPLSSCNESNLPDTYPEKIKDETGKLTDEVKSEIQITYHNKYGKELSKISGVCYGVFDDAYCLILDPNGFFVDSETYVDVGEYQFRFNDGRQMSVYSNGDFFDLKQAYENEILNNNELTELYVFYNYVNRGRKDKEQVEMPGKGENLPISAEIKEEIQKFVLTEKYGEGYQNKGFDPIDVDVVCYGIFDNAYCVITWQDLNYPFNFTEVTLGEHTFTFATDKIINVYFEGKFYSLPEAYGNGVLDDADISELYEYYTVTRLGKS